ncbi:MAG: NAD-dependent epimerase/dehydratase family protein [Gammaproteobacteria bacterium]|nr:MAG: NAD-dependent epimerase/dehydratase family protein [Gammaproteobacteria bacterium]
MHIVVTGANGFIGSHLTKALLERAERDPAAWPLQRLTAVDLSLNQLPDHSLLRRIEGSFADDAALQRALTPPADLVFHLASVPSGRSETDPALGMAVNVQGTLRLLDMLKAQGNAPTVVFASSIAVYGKPQAPLVTDDTPPLPTLSYGAHKVIGEILVNDHVRRGWIKGCSLRLPGIVTRPPEPNGAVSIFLSDLIRELSQGRPFTCPTSRDAHTWLMSIGCCVENLLHAARQTFGERRTFLIPPLHVHLGSLVQAIGEQFQIPTIDRLIAWQPDPWVEFNFGSYPPVQLPLAEAQGFQADRDLRSLVADSLASGY